MEIHTFGPVREAAESIDAIQIVDTVAEAAQKAEEKLLGAHDPSDRNFVMDVRPLNRKRANIFRHGRTFSELYTLEDDRQYVVITGIPHKQLTDVPIVEGTALGTSVHGHNTHTMLDFMELGFPVMLIGPEGGNTRIPRNPKRFKKYCQNMARISIRETADNIHEILDYADVEGPLSTQTVIKTGESRDAAIGMGFNANAGKFERDVLYSDLIAPPFPYPKPIEYKNPKMSYRRLKEVADQISSLAVHSLTEVDLPLLRHYSRTLDPNPLFLLHVVMTVGTLVNGTAGKLAAKIPKDAKMHNLHFSEDPWTDIDGWEERFRGHRLVQNEVQPGDHGAILRKSTQEARLLRLDALLEEMLIKGNKVNKYAWKGILNAGENIVLSPDSAQVA
jgi:hypothetical protein